MTESDRQFIWLITAILYMIALGWAASHTEQWLELPRGRHKVTWQDAHVCTGDLLLFSSHPTLRTDVEKLLCGSQFTHVALIFVDAAGQPYVWECLLSGHRMSPLATVLAKAAPHQSIFWRRINRPLDGREFERFVRHNLAHPYSFNLWRGVVRRWCSSLYLPQAPASNARFCSQLVAETYECLGALDFTHSANLSPNLVLPGDFGAGRGFTLPWVNGYSLGGEVELLVVS
jgi:hypothetical protein